jgi:hypothetical protein
VAGRPAFDTFLTAGTNPFPLQTWLAGKVGGAAPDYGMGMLIVMIPVFLAVIFFTAPGPENRGAEFGKLDFEREPTGRFAREPAQAPSRTSPVS